jgi:hypothetical protein
MLKETMDLLSQITTPILITSDHYTNYLDINGRLPEDRDAMLEALRRALGRDESTFRPFFIGSQRPVGTGLKPASTQPPAIPLIAN